MIRSLVVAAAMLLASHIAASAQSPAQSSAPSTSVQSLLNDGYVSLDHSIWTALFAGLALTAATLGFTLFGEALRDAVDPKLKAER